MRDSESEDGGLVFRARALNPSGDVFGLRAKKALAKPIDHTAVVILALAVPPM
jgi:hypothetical protein